jgi:hypothetical protein
LSLSAIQTHQTIEKRCVGSRLHQREKQQLARGKAAIELSIGTGYRSMRETKSIPDDVTGKQFRKDPHFFEIAYRMTLGLIKRAVAEDDLAELSMFIERLELSVEEDGGYRSSRQGDIVKECAAKLQEALDVPRGPSAVGEKVDLDRDDPDWAPKAWVDGRSTDLEEALEGKNREEVNEVEDRAAWMLRGRYPDNPWKDHQQYLYLRVDRRLARDVERVQLGAMPAPAARRFKDYPKFSKGSCYLKGKGSYRYNFRDYVSVVGGGNRAHGYVCHETPCYAWMIYDDGVVFYKSHANVKLVEQFVGERFSREYREGTAPVNS